MRSYQVLESVIKSREVYTYREHAAMAFADARMMVGNFAAHESIGERVECVAPVV